jgi:nucleolar protein TMA23
MDAHSLLTSQGWRGSGHSLHPTSDNTGLSRPLLVSRKQNTLGVGKKQHRTSDMWWMNAFDKSLKGLETTEEGRIVQAVTNGGLDMVAKGGSKFVGSGGLYASFVRGESLIGTIPPENYERPLSIDKSKLDMVTCETKQERRLRKAAKRTARLLEEESPALGAADEVNDEGVEVEAREQRRERRRQRKLLHKAEKGSNDIAAVAHSTKRKSRQREKCRS